MIDVTCDMKRSAIKSGATDAELVEHFLRNRDEAAFAAMLERHGRMVWGVCRRVLGNHQDAEDAFQATFLVLIRNAGSITSPGLLANWLYGVAANTALKAKAAQARRRTKEKQLTDLPESEAVAENDSNAAYEKAIWNEIEPLLDQELSRLPDVYRAAVVLCDLDGLTRRQAAEQLGWPEGTVAGRLVRARNILAQRLRRHGFALSGVTLATLLTEHLAVASPPPALLSATLKTAGGIAIGKAAVSAVVSAEVAGLAQGVIETMFWTKLKVAVAVVVLLVVMAAGTLTGSLIQQRLAEEQADSADDSKDSKTRNNPATETPKEAGKKYNLADLGPIDESMLTRISITDGGRIEKLFKRTDDRVKKGELLLEYDSNAMRTRTLSFGPDIHSKDPVKIEKALRIAGYETDQIDEFKKGGKLSYTARIRSPIDGVIYHTHQPVGAYVEPKDPLFDLVDIAFFDQNGTQREVEGSIVEPLLRERVEVLRQIAAFVNEKFKVGGATPEEVLKAQQNVHRAELELAKTDRESIDSRKAVEECQRIGAGRNATD